MDLNELREEVLRRQRAANAKVSRLRRKGVQIAGTNYDVRRSANIKRYNSKQLTKYLGELNSFTSRSNQFVAGSEGVPIPANKWRAFQKVQNAYNNVARGHYESVKGTHIKASGMSVADFDSKVRSNRPGAKGGISRPLEPSRNAAYEIVDEKRLDKLRKQLERKIQPEYLPAQLKNQRKRMISAVSVFGDKEMIEKAKALTDEQFDTLWNYTDAPRDLFGGYHFMKLLSTSQADEGHANVHEDDKSETRGWLEWAAALPPRQNRKNRR